MLSLEYSPEISGGVGTHVQELTTGLARSGVFVTVLSGTIGKHEVREEENKSVHLVPPDIGGGARRSIVQGIMQYNQTLTRYARQTVLAAGAVPDLIHCHNWISYPAAAEIARLIGVPVVVTVHYVSKNVEQWWGQAADPEILEQEEQMFRGGGHFIAVSRSIRSLMREAYSVPEDDVQVIYNAIDSMPFLKPVSSDGTRERLRKALAPGNHKIVLYTGRFHPMKGIPALLESASLVLKREPNVRYVLAGEPDSQQFALEFRSLLGKYPVLREKMTVLGKLSRKRVIALYSVADLAILPSVFDPCPYAAIEAMVAGIPLVGSDGGGLGELIEHEVTGLTVPVRSQNSGLRGVNAMELAEATLRLLRDESLARSCGEKARKKALNTLSMSGMVDATRDIYEHVLHPVG